MPRLPNQVALLALLAAVPAGAAPEVVVSEGTNLSVDVSPADGRLAMDLLGSIWIVPARGGEASRITDGAVAATRPRWSPDGGRILYQAARPEGSDLRVHDLETSADTAIGDGRYYDQHGGWHPQEERVVYSSERRDSGLDLWELDLPTGRSSRLTFAAGDESEPAWSPDGRRLAWIHRDEEEWRLMLAERRRDEGIPVVVSEQPLAAPAWRPDGSLITFLRRHEGRYRLEVVILSDPPVVRAIAEDQDFFLAPAAWIDRLRFLYTADGLIKARSINEWGATPVPFAASVALPEAGVVTTVAKPPLPLLSPPANRLVLRAARLFDGVSAGYRDDVDIVIEGGVIAAIEERREREDETVLELAGTTVLPGLIDVHSRLPEEEQQLAGLRLLSYGVTTVVAEAPAAFDAAAWETEEMPGPRLMRSAAIAAAGEPGDEEVPWALVTLPAGGAAGSREQVLVRGWQERGVPVLAESWNAGERVGADLSVARDSLPASPLGRRYQDLKLTAGGGPVNRISALADAATPGLEHLLRSRQAELYPEPPRAPRRHSAPPAVYGSPTSVVVGSKPNGLPAGLALHAELRALTAAGLRPADALQAATANAARVLGRPLDIGRIEPGARADLVLVSGDPLARIEDALDIVAVVRNGRFYSLVRLLEELRDGG